MEALPYPIYFLIIPVGLRLTCYYFHGWYEERIFRPFARLLFRSDGFMPEFANGWFRNLSLDMFHRYFMLLSLFLIADSLLISAYHTLVAPALWVQMDSIQSLFKVFGSLAQPNTWSLHFNIFNFTEWADSLLLVAYVGTCHVFRYFLGSSDRCISCGRHKILARHTLANRLHDKLFWVSIATVIAHMALVQAFNMGLIVV